MEVSLQQKQSECSNKPAGNQQRDAGMWQRLKEIEKERGKGKEERKTDRRRKILRKKRIMK